MGDEDVYERYRRSQRKEVVEVSTQFSSRTHFFRSETLQVHLRYTEVFISRVWVPLFLPYPLGPPEVVIKSGQFMTMIDEIIIFIFVLTVYDQSDFVRTSKNLRYMNSLLLAWGERVPDDIWWVCKSKETV